MLGRSANIVERSKETMSRKEFLTMKDNEFFSQRKVFGNQLFGVPNTTSHKYKLDPVATMVM